MNDANGSAPETRSPRFLRLIFSACAAPVAWLGQMLLGYGITAYMCFPADRPVSHAATGPLFAALVAFDFIALGMCGAGAWISLSHWRCGLAGRDRFLALWGLMSSLWFLAAILFNVIASLAVPPCLS